GAGLVIGALIVERSVDRGPWPRAVTRSLTVEAAILGIFAIGTYLTAVVREVWEAQVLIALSAMAMGIQSAAVRRLDVPGISTSYVTGPLTTAVPVFVARSGSRGPGSPSPQDPPDAGAGSPSPQDPPDAGAWWRRVRLQVLTLIVYGFGALIAGV